jgi:hypothetical protein
MVRYVGTKNNAKPFNGKTGVKEGVVAANNVGSVSAFFCTLNPTYFGINGKQTIRQNGKD